MGTGNLPSVDSGISLFIGTGWGNPAPWAAQAPKRSWTGQLGGAAGRVGAKSLWGAKSWPPTLSCGFMQLVRT